MGRPDKIRSVLLDTSALIGVVKGDPEFACLRSLFTAIDQEKVTLVESTAILVEFAPIHRRDNGSDVGSRAKVRSLLESPATQLVDVSTLVAQKASALSVEHGLKTLDAIHLATAILAKVDVLFVRDVRFPVGECEGVWITTAFDLDEDKLPPEMLVFPEST